MSRRLRGRAHPGWKGFSGLYFDGERWVVKTRSGASVRWARVLMWDHLGRELDSNEHVHHLNNDRSDDRLENLSVVDIREHGRLHGTQAWIERKAMWVHAWSEQHPCCVSCGTVDRPHQSHGLCIRCDGRKRMREWRARRATA